MKRFEESNEDYEAVAAEIDEGKVNRGLWERIFSEVDGDASKTRARYIAHRVAQIRGTKSGQTADGISSGATTLSGTSIGVTNRRSTQGLFFVDPGFVEISEFFNGLAVASIYGEKGRSRKGYINPEGKFIVGPKFSELESHPADGVAIAKLGHGWHVVDPLDRWRCGIIDLNGRDLIEPQQYPFVERVGSKIFFLNENSRAEAVYDIGTRSLAQPTKKDLQDCEFRGGNLIPWKFTDVLSRGFWDRGKIGKYGYRDRRYRWAIEPRFDAGGPFWHGRANVGIGPETRQKQFLIDEEGRQTTKETFDELFQMKPQGHYLQCICANGHGAARRWFHTNWNGERLYRNQFLNVFPLSKVGLMAGAQSESNGLWGITDHKGNFLIDPRYDGAHPLSEDTVALSINEQFGIYNLGGKLLVPHSFNDVKYLGEGLLAASVADENAATLNAKRESERWGLISLASIR